MNQVATDSRNSISEEPIIGNGDLRHSEHKDLLLSFELIDLHLLETEVAPLYTPTTNPWVMVIGANDVIREATIIREFHSTKFDISPTDVTVVGCTTFEHPSDHKFEGDFDLTLTGEYFGDAQEDLTWLRPLNKLRADRTSYDFTYIRNPDLISISNWAAVYARAVEFTRPEGAIVTTIRRNDTHRYEQLLSILEDKYNIRPVLSKETGIKDPLDQLFQHHTLGVFKSSS